MTLISNTLADTIIKKCESKANLWTHEAYNATADIWSLGITCIEMAFPAEFEPGGKSLKIRRFLSIQQPRIRMVFWCLEVVDICCMMLLFCSTAGVPGLLSLLVARKTHRADRLMCPGRLSAAVLSHPANSGDVCDQYQTAHRCRHIGHPWGFAFDEFCCV